ncbi:MAG: 4-hydroxy-3-methylbut-2-en-1-yl diphosphate synthase (ferredoxin) [Chlamydiales bacterium]|nr:4-hydroxy-3-methylbut-2-en-1-yl diphosphate synthase (ferredoxin) [Chlamydiales bacterium]
MKYCEKIYQTLRRKTRVVQVGSVGVGGDNPVRIQSMTTSDTRDVEKTVDQIMRLADRGCEIARITVQGKKEAEACEGIKEGLTKRGYTIPLVADIHFYPPAAMVVADFADKVRINPGNFIDKRASFKIIEYDEKTYAEEIERLEEKFTPLVEKCKRLKRALRIGTNHGSLSDRIMNRYGDSPRGMVESALEFTRVCRKNDFHDIIFSMKASNTQVMIEAYRLLSAQMLELDWDYPLHLGVTEAGEGEDGRVKSAIGIGSLLLDGLGDTIRVSLTEDPWFEIDPCKRLVSFAQNCEQKGIAPFEEKQRNIESLVRRSVDTKAPLHRDGSVIVKVTDEEIAQDSFFADIGCQVQLGKVSASAGAIDALITTSTHPKLEKLKTAGIGILKETYIATEDSSTWKPLLTKQPDFLLFAPKTQSIHHGRAFFEWLKEHRLTTPVILNFSYKCPEEDLPIHASAECGALLCDALGEGVCLEADIPLSARVNLSFSILQGARMRSSKTEFISCPGCGRTLFNLQEVAENIRERTAHLPGVKIAIMGCIVNGPGEMADADFGYVGSLPGKIDLYVGKERVEKHIPMEEAVERLVTLIKKHDRWVEPQV